MSARAGYWLVQFLSCPSKYVCSAKGAASSASAWGRPLGFEDPKNSSAKSAIHSRHWFDPPPGLKRAFSACLHCDLQSWGDAPGSVETAPLALSRDSLSKGGG
jgi:hypothetical protein